jgi:hypothetical protein
MDFVAAAASAAKNKMANINLAISIFYLSQSLSEGKAVYNLAGLLPKHSFCHAVFFSPFDIWLSLNKLTRYASRTDSFG